MLLGIILIFDSLELLRRASKRADVPIGAVIEMSLFKLPEVGQQVMPLAVLFAAMFTFWRLTRSQELVIARAAGISAWQFLLPALFVGLAVGFFKVGALNPMSTVLLTKFTELENQFLRGRASGINLTDAGLWLRQDTAGGEILIHATSIDPLTMSLSDTSVLFFEDARYLGRLDAPSAQLTDGAWIFSSGWLNEVGRPEQQVVRYRLATDLTREVIEDTFAAPELISFWALPDYIQTLDRAGLPSTRTQMHYQALIAEPFLFLGMVLIAAAFSLRPPRKGGTLVLVSSGLLAGFGFFFLRDLAHTLGASETIPIVAAAWTPAVCSIMAGMAALLYSEDG